MAAHASHVRPAYIIILLVFVEKNFLTLCYSSAQH
jgi:hypothetical protein